MAGTCAIWFFYRNSYFIIDICDDLRYNYHYGIIRSLDSFYIDEEDAIIRYWQVVNLLSSDMKGKKEIFLVLENI